MKGNLETLRAIVLATPLLLLVACKKSEPPQSTPPEVEVVQVEQKDVPLERVGRYLGWDGQRADQVAGDRVSAQTELYGRFQRQEGQLLFEIDPRTFQAALDQVKAQLANAEGQLAQAEANQVKAQLDVNRYVPLAKEQAVTQQDLDNAVQANVAAQAQVRAAKAQIDAAKAQVTRPSSIWALPGSSR